MKQIDSEMLRLALVGYGQELAESMRPSPPYETQQAAAAEADHRYRAQLKGRQRKESAEGE